MSNSFSPSTMLDMALAPTALLTTLLTSAVVTPHFWHFSGSTRNWRCDDPRTWKMPTLAMPWTSLQDVLGLLGQQLQLVEVRAEDLEGIVPLDPRQSLHHVVADVLREVPRDARNARSRSAFIALTISRFDRARVGPQIHRRQPVCRHQLGPVFLGPQRHEVLAAVITLGVRAVVGPAALRHDRLDLGVAGHDGPRLLGDRHLVVQIHVERTDAAEP